MDVTFDCIPNARELVAIEYLRCASSLDFKLSLSESVTFFYSQRIYGSFRLFFIQMFLTALGLYHDPEDLTADDIGTGYQWDTSR